VFTSLSGAHVFPDWFDVSTHAPNREIPFLGKCVKPHVGCVIGCMETGAPGSSVFFLLNRIIPSQILTQSNQMIFLLGLIGLMGEARYLSRNDSSIGKLFPVASRSTRIALL
jgi:hypothetical protein